MNLFWFFYIAEFIPKVGTFASIFSTALGIFFMLAACAYIFATLDPDVPDDLQKIFGKFFWGLLWPFLFCLSLALAMPSQDTIYKMGAAVAAEYIIELEQVQEIGGELTGLTTDTIKMLRTHIQGLENSDDTAS